jgi:hypothetical protein
LKEYVSDLGFTQNYAVTEILSLILTVDTLTGMESASQVGCTSFVLCISQGSLTPSQDRASVIIIIG